jgi:hypothetical protein
LTRNGDEWNDGIDEEDVIPENELERGYFEDRIVDRIW